MIFFSRVSYFAFPAFFRGKRGFSVSFSSPDARRQFTAKKVNVKVNVNVKGEIEVSVNFFYSILFFQMLFSLPFTIKAGGLPTVMTCV